MSRPIFTVGLPLNDFDQERLKETAPLIKDAAPDYNVLVYTHGGNEFKFDVYYEKDFNEVKYEELKEIIKEKCEK